MLYKVYFNSLFIVFTEAMSTLLAIQGNNFKICKVQTNYCATHFLLLTVNSSILLQWFLNEETTLEYIDSRIRKDWKLCPFVMMYVTFTAVPCSPAFTLKCIWQIFFIC